MLVPLEPPLVEGSVVLIPHQSMSRNRTGEVVVSVIGAEGLAEALELGETLADGEREGDAEALAEDDGEREVEELGLSESEALGLLEALGLREADGDIDADAEGDNDADGEREALTEEEATGLILTDTPSSNGIPFPPGQTNGELWEFASALNVMRGTFPKEVAPAYTSATQLASPATSHPPYTLLTEFSGLPFSSPVYLNSCMERGG